METANKDVIMLILAYCDIKSFAHVAKTSKRLRLLAIEWVDGPIDGLIARYTCSCGEIGWNIRQYCDCWMPCNCCNRGVPIHLRCGCQYRICRYGCSGSACCFETLTARNVYSFAGWLTPTGVTALICKDHIANRKIIPMTRDLLAWFVIKRLLYHYNKTDCVQPLPFLEVEDAYNLDPAAPNKHADAFLGVVMERDPDNPLIPLFAELAH